MGKKQYTEQRRKEFTEANRKAWNQAAPYHRKANHAELVTGFAQPGFSTLSPHCREKLEDLVVTGKSIAQLCCNNGVELLSIKNMGAGKCVGFDAAEEFIADAREYCGIAGHNDVDFVATDIYDIHREKRGPYDIVLSTIGVISWMPDLEALFNTYASLARPGGHVFIEEMHPVLFMYEEDSGGGPSFLKYSYFNQEPFEEQSGLDYYGDTDYCSSTHFSFIYTLSEIMNAAIGAGLVLQDFTELDYDISFFCSDLEQAEAVPPLGMTMTWEKPGYD